MVQCMLLIKAVIIDVSADSIVCVTLPPANSTYGAHILIIREMGVRS